MPPTESPDDTAFTCHLSGEELDRRVESLARLVGEAQSVREIADGLALIFPAGDEVERRLVDAVLVERRCCPFFRFELVFEPDNGPVRLRLRGPAEPRELLRLLMQESPGAS